MGIICSICLLLGPNPGWAAYPDSLKTGDTARAKGESEAALAAYVQAEGEASNDTETALALSKQAHVLAYDNKDYEAAEEKARAALAISGVEPIGHVIAHQALAECLEKKMLYSEAINTLEQALTLQGVDWARSGLLLALGDAYRFSGIGSKGIEAYEKVIALPDASAKLKAVAYLNIGLTEQYGNRNPEAARAAYEKARGLDDSLSGEIDGHLGKLGSDAPAPYPTSYN